jgi:RNA recognition motif-containing protein
MSANMQQSKIRSTNYSNPPFESSTPSYKVFVGGLPHNATKDAIFSYFCKFAEVINIDLPKNPKTQKLKGFGFVFFSSPSEI